MADYLEHGRAFPAGVPAPACLSDLLDHREGTPHPAPIHRFQALLAAIAGGLLISPNSIVHFPGCHDKGPDDPDYSRWARLDTPRAWERLGNGEQLPATDGQSAGLIARTRCQDCVSHGPW